MKSNPRSGRPAFTLIELMAVITIIVILAALVIGSMGFVQDKQARSKAKVQVELLSKALEEYKLDTGSYPASTKDDGTGQSDICLYQALFYEGYTYTKATTPPSPWTKGTKIYVADLDPITNKQGWEDPVTATTPPASAKVKDPWGYEYRYRSAAANPSGTQNPDFDLWSVGKDGSSTTTPSDKGNRDDIRNF